MEGRSRTTIELEQSAIACDEFGPARIVQVFEPNLGLKAALVVDNVAIGPSIGGVRMAPDVSIAECARLARAMTLKNAAAGLRHGGGKAVLFGDPKMPKAAKERLIRALARALQHDEDYIFGPDMGTDEECMAWVNDEIGRADHIERDAAQRFREAHGATDLVVDPGHAFLVGSHVRTEDVILVMRECAGERTDQPFLLGLWHLGIAEED